MSKSLIIEIIAILWFILATQTTGWPHLIALLLGIENSIEAAVRAYLEKKS